MHFGFVSTEGSTTSLWLKLLDEGHEVTVWIADRKFEPIGEGLVDKVESFEALLQVEPDIFIFDGSGKGDLADKIRREGKLVVGGCKFADKLEKDRSWSQKLAEHLGMQSPPTKEFSTISQAIEFAKGNKESWVFKSNKYLEASSTYCASGPEDMVGYLNYIKSRFGDNVSNILQLKLDGAALSTAGWFNGKTFLKPLLFTIEHKKFLTGDLGPSTGCSFNYVTTLKKESKVSKVLNEAEEFFRKAEAAPGIYDINALIRSDNHEPCFLEWTPRFGYDSEPTSLRGLVIELGDFLYRLATGGVSVLPFASDEAWMSVRITVPPYPYEHSKPGHDAIGLPVLGTKESSFVPYGIGCNENGIYVADPMGCVGLIAADGKDVDEMASRITKDIEDLEIPGLQYRTDAADCIKKDLHGVT